MAGVSQEVLDEYIAHLAPPDDDFDVYEENWECLNLFLALQNDWSMVAGLRMVFIGIRTEAIESVFNIYKIPHKQRAKLHFSIKLMESAAKPLLNKVKD